MNSFSNLKITAEFESGVIFDKNPFDGVLAYLYAQELKKQGKYVEYEKKRIELPFVKKTNGVYHTSYPIIADDEKIYLENTTIIRSFDENLFQKIGDKPNKTIRIQNGEFLRRLEGMERYKMKTLHWFVCGDKEKIKQILKGFTHFGKKSSIGFGKIKQLLISETKDDYSLFDEKGNVNRTLPIEFFNAKSDKIAYKSPIYPYWDKQSFVKCYL